MSNKLNTVSTQSSNMEKGKCTSEYLSKDMFDEDFLKVFKPFRCFQMFFGSCRVDAKYLFVTAPTVFQKIYSLLIMIILFMIYMLINSYACMRYQNVYYLKMNVGLVIYGHYFFYLLSIINARFFSNSMNVEFYSKLSQIDKVFKLEYNKTVKTSICTLNWMTIAMLLIIALLIVGIVTLLRSVYYIALISAILFTHCTMHMELSFCSNILVYLGVSIRVVNHIVSCHLNKVEQNITAQRVSIIQIYFLKALGPRTYDLFECKIDTYLNVVFSAFEHFQEMFRFQIFLFTSKVVMYVVLTFQFTLLNLQSNIPDRVGIIILAMLTATDVFGFLLLCLRCEMFEKETRRAKLLSIKVMSVYQSGPLRDRAKKIYKLIEDTPPRFSVYGMWELETSIFIKVCNVVTGFFVTLLQFAFL